MVIDIQNVEKSMMWYDQSQGHPTFKFNLVFLEFEFVTYDQLSQKGVLKSTEDKC